MLIYLIEFRRRAMQLLIFFALMFFICFYFSEALLHYFLIPLLKVAPGVTIIATQISTPVLIPVKLAINTALLLTAPLFLLQLWLFLSPGLYNQERKKFSLVLLGSSALFVVGLLFCFYVVLPFMFQFVIDATHKNINLMPDIAATLDFITRMLLIFGIFFQIPLISVVLQSLNIVTVEQLKKIRSYFIVAAFIIGMLLAPPDVVSQTLLAIPLCFLYELGIILSKFNGGKLNFGQRNLSHH